MAKCCDKSPGCDCLIQAGDGISVTGSGSALNSYTITAETPAFTTANRPAASGYSPGAMIYDTDLNRPLWSDGANWRFADGIAA